MDKSKAPVIGTKEETIIQGLENEKNISSGLEPFSKDSTRDIKYLYLALFLVVLIIAVGSIGKWSF